jgi:hypothetical protein
LGANVITPKMMDAKIEEDFHDKKQVGWDSKVIQNNVNYN